ncbi:MAG: hypothetical protein ABIU96_13620, partial [Rhodanobacter sp.]
MVVNNREWFFSTASASAWKRLSVGNPGAGRTHLLLPLRLKALRQCNIRHAPAPQWCGDGSGSEPRT